VKRRPYREANQEIVEEDVQIKGSSKKHGDQRDLLEADGLPLAVETPVVGEVGDAKNGREPG
jgi:hypothetical protein